MRLTFSINEKAGAAADAAAQAEGLTRSRWIARLIERELAARPALPPPPKHRLGDRRYLTLRVDAPVIDAIDVAAHSAGMKRNQWIINVLTSRVFNKDGEILLSPIARQKLTDQRGQLLAIGRNINQAVHAINSAVMPDSGMNLVQCVNHLLAMRDELEEAMTADRISLLEMANAERRYWRGESSDA
ncbi:MAG: hypothetical protein ACK52H_10580 [Burkholderiales bacterium]|jgi:predicted HicB family RNase H-like nuclease